MFTQQHYIAVAKVLKERVSIMTNSEGSFIRSGTVQAFVSLFEKDNPTFDAEKFLDEIYGKEESN